MRAHQLMLAQQQIEARGVPLQGGHQSHKERMGCGEDVVRASDEASAARPGQVQPSSRVCPGQAAAGAAQGACDARFFYCLLSSSLNLRHQPAQNLLEGVRLCYEFIP